MNYIEEIFNSAYSKDEMQAIFFISLCCLGAWVFVSWIIQIIRSVLWIWPLVLIVGLLLAAPSLRLRLTQEILPKQMDDIMQLIDEKYPYYNNETLRWFNT